MVIPQRRGRDGTTAELACSAFTARERMRFDEVDNGDTRTYMCTLTQVHAHALKNMNAVKQTPIKCVNMFMLIQ